MARTVHRLLIARLAILHDDANQTRDQNREARGHELTGRECRRAGHQRDCECRVRCKHPREHGQKVSGTTRSSPVRADAGKMLPDSKPIAVPAFHARYMLTPAPKSTGMRSGPRAAATPYAPSVKNQATTGRRLQFGAQRSLTAAPRSGK